MSKQEEQNKEEGRTKAKGKKRPAPKSAPKDVLTQQNRSFEKDLLQAMDLSMQYMDKAKEKAESDRADIQKAVEMSLKDSPNNISEAEQVRLAIELSLKDIVQTRAAIDA